MPFYYKLRNEEISPEERVRTVEGLQRLRAQIQQQIPARTVRDTLLLATWNVRDLGNEDKRFDPGTGPGPRFGESYHYLAEVISAFDLVALQEVNTMAALKQVMAYLGPSWDFLTTDLKRSKGGNQERMTFVYDTRKVRFRNVTGQIVDDASRQFARTPFHAAFQSGWFKFALATVHILYGDYRDTSERVKEIDRIAGFLSERAADTGENIILVGDFNILSRDDATFAPLAKHGWHMPLDYNTNVLESKAYDQIALKVKDDELLLGNGGGTFNFFDAVFRDQDFDTYYAVAGAKDRPLEPWDNTVFWKDKKKPRDQQRILTREEYYRDWRTWQMSDHFPLWVELKIDFTDAYLERTRTWTP